MVRPTTPLRGAVIDRATQRWVIRTGRAVSLAHVAWLAGPVGSPDGVGERWIDEHAVAAGATVVEDPAGGLLPDMAALDGGAFRAEQLHPLVRDFYEHTAAWQLDVWSRWARWAEPGGRLIHAMFARRLRQLALPLDPLDVAYGMDSRVIALRSPGGDHLGTAWQRTLRATSTTVFGGLYTAAELPGDAPPVVRVAFPLPNGSLTVLLRPIATRGGALRLESGRGGFGDPGAYLLVRPAPGESAWVRRVPLHECFDVFVDARGELRCDHRLRLSRAEILRLHYRMRPG